MCSDVEEEIIKEVYEKTPLHAEIKENILQWKCCCSKCKGGNRS